jgi:hypothetical protein
VTTIPQLLAEVLSELRDVGHDADVEAIEACDSDHVRGRILYDVSTEIRLVDRRMHLRLASAFLSYALRSAADGSGAEAERWRDRAKAELERYRERVDADPYQRVTGGVL